MGRRWSPGLRRALLLYCAAVVVPTLVVLTLGILAARRQYQAVETLQTTTRRLQESRVAEEIERRIAAAASAAIRSDDFERTVAGLVSDRPDEIDAARSEIDGIRAAHPIVRDVFLVKGGTVIYPRVQPSLPHDLGDWLRNENASIRNRLSVVLSEAEKLESDRNYRAAEAAYRTAAALAATPRIKALAISGLARALAGAGDAGHAADMWELVAREFGDVYNRHGRPHALVAAVALGDIAPDRQLVAEVRGALLGGRWTVTPDQADYFLSKLPGAQTTAAHSGFLKTLAFGRRMRSAFSRTAVPENGEVNAASIFVDGVGDQLLFAWRTAESVLAGIAVDGSWVQGTLAPEIAAQIAPGFGVRVAAPAPQALSFRAGTAPWQVSIAAEDLAPWRRRDVWALAGGAVMLVGILALSVVLLARDVTRETDLNRMRADLVSGVSHELKSPLSVIRVYAETIDVLPGEQAGERRHFAAAIVQETERLCRLIEDVVDFSKIQQGRRPYRLAAGSLASTVSRAAERFEEYGSLHGFTLRADVPLETPHVDFDERAVEQAILNLLDNAAKYAGESTEIDLRVWSVDEEVLVAVRDHGIGIAHDDQARIFERFHRGAHADRGGYGLGLYLVRHIMEAHGGRVDVSSAPGEGSQFTLHFPVSEANEDAESSADRG